jgi:glutamyl-tRNA synthetase
MNTPVRVRIAPSPTGYLHVGTARTAVFNWLYARHTGGKFLVRIEDTDAERSKAELIEPILSAIKWLGLDWDEEILYQSQRMPLYAESAKKILETPYGYRCFCSTQQLDEDRKAAQAEKRAPKYNRRCLGLSPDEVKRRMDAGEKFVIRLRVPDGEITFDDIVAGAITVKSEDIEDLVLARADGSATYNLAVVVDDHAMGVTHIMRGNDHITNTFKQIFLYKALGWEIPRFGHVPLILRPDKKKVSKRLGDKDVNQYATEGILPEAMLNYLCLLGWSSKTNQEIFLRDELVTLFTTDNLNASNAVFDEEKLIAFNKAHILRKPDGELAELAAPFFISAGLLTEQALTANYAYFLRVVSALKERVRRLSDFVSLGGYFYRFDGVYDPEAEKKQFTPDKIELLRLLADRFEQLPSFTKETAEEALKALAESRGLSKGALIHPTRLACSGMSVGPGLYEMLDILTRSVVVSRMRMAADYISGLNEREQVNK